MSSASLPASEPLPVPAAPAPAAAPAPSADFADWLSPILVKELRQGLKARVFVGVFIVLQIAMVLTMGLRLLEQSEHRDASQAFDAFFWSLLWFPLIVVMPSRGLAAISEETRSNTFDLVQLTRMTAFRIALGKWTALVAQSALLVASLLPYTVLRYYFGGVNIVQDLQIIAGLLLASMVLTAAAIMLSGASIPVRVLALLAGGPFFLSGTSGLFTIIGGLGMMFRPAAGTFLSPGASWLFSLIIAGTCIFTFLEFTAASFAPPTENHALRKRLTGLAIATIQPLAALLSSNFGLLLALALTLKPLVLWILLDALTETPTRLPSVLAPLARRGWIGRLLGRLLNPGWATAIPFAALTIAISTWGISDGARPGSDGAELLRIVRLMLFFALISPLPLLLAFPRARQRFWLYVLVQLGFALLFVFTLAASGFGRTGQSSAARWLAPFPTSALLALAWQSDNLETCRYLYRVSCASGALILFGLSFAIVREFRLMGRLEREALSQKPAAANA